MSIMRSIHITIFVLAMNAALSAGAAPGDIVYTTGMTGEGLIKVGEHMPVPPPDPPGTATPMPTGRALQNQIVADFKKRFDAAADPATHLLTATQAKSAGWGYVADHFNEIDAANKGSVSFSDLMRYLRSKKGPAFNSQND
jgi:hypothetical protein